MKKFIWIIVSLLVFALVVAGCQPQASNGAEPVEEPAAEEPAVEEPAVEEPAVDEPAVDEPATDEQVEVTFWSAWGGTREPLMQEMIAKFEAEHPNIKVNLVTVDGSVKFEKLLTAVAGGDPPDIYMSGTNESAMLYDLDVLLPVNEFIEKDGIDIKSVLYPGVVDGVTFDGNIIMLPFKVPVEVMVWYNIELWEEAGLTDEDIPETWDELLDVGKQLAKVEGDKIEVAPMNTCINCINGSEFPFNYFASRNNVSFYNDTGTEFAIDRELTIETLAFMKEFMDETVGGYGNFITQFGTDFADNRPAFYAGKLAMHMDGVWFYDIIKNEAEEGFIDKVGLFLVPINGENPAATQHYITYGVPGYGIVKGAKQPEAAWELLKWISYEEDGGCEFFKIQGRPDNPSSQCINQEAATENPFWDLFLINLETTDAVPFPPEHNEIFLMIKDITESVLMGEVTPEEGADLIIQEANAILD